MTVKEVENRFSVSHTTAKSDLDGLVSQQFLKKIPINKVNSATLRENYLILKQDLYKYYLIIFLCIISANSCKFLKNLQELAGV